MSLPGYDAWKTTDPREYECDVCEECGEEKRWDRIARVDICGCNAREYFGGDDNEYIDDRDGPAADRMAP